MWVFTEFRYSYSGKLGHIWERLRWFKVMYRNTWTVKGALLYKDGAWLDEEMALLLDSSDVKDC